MKISTDLSEYSALEKLRNGQVIELRATKPGDRDKMMKAIDRTSNESLYRRFFSPKRSFSEKEVNYLLEIDFVKQVALVVVLEEASRPIIAGGRYIVYQPGCAELAFVVEDAYQGQGIGSLLMRHLITIASKSGLDELHAEVLPSNESMLKVFERTGLVVSTTRDQYNVHITLRLR
jgi:ribosomal protein S18 acetylase RimI-like enzyme